MPKQTDEKDFSSFKNVACLDKRREDRKRDDQLAQKVQQELDRLRVADTDFKDSIYAISHDQMHILAASRSIASIAKGIQARQYVGTDPCDNGDTS